MKGVNRAIAEGWNSQRINQELAQILRALKREERLASLGHNIGSAVLDSLPGLEVINELPDQNDGLEAA